MALSISPAEIVESGEYPLLVKHETWERVLFGQVATVQNGFPFESRYFDRENGVPLIRIRDVTNAETEHRYTEAYDPDYLVHRGNVLIGMDGDFKAARWKGTKGLLNQRVCRIELSSKHFDEDFLVLCLQPYLDAINAETSSVTVKHLSSRSVEQIPLPLPPLREQRRIVAKVEELFSELDKGNEVLISVREQLKAYRQSVLKHAFEGKLTEQWRARNHGKLETPDKSLANIRAYAEARFARAVHVWEAAGRKGPKPTRPTSLEEAAEVHDFSSLSPLPEGWTYLPFGALAYSIRNGISKKPDETGRLRIFRISAVRPMEFDMSDFRHISDDPEFHSYRLRRGDVVFTRYNGSRAYVGVAAIFRSDEEFIYPDKLIRCEVQSPLVDSGYIEKAVNCAESRAFIETRIRTTAGQAGISGADLKAMPVPICSIVEQKEINQLLEARLSRVVELENELELWLSQIEALRQSILKRAFSGQLVAQKPTDEPGSVLLERIREEREEMNAKKERATKSGKRKAA